MSAKNIYINLKRFDISPFHGGVNRIAPMQDWGATVMKQVCEITKLYENKELFFTMYLPEAHLIKANVVPHKKILLGCQSVYHKDSEKNGNFGAFTSYLSANAAVEMGCVSTIIGHYEERSGKADILKMANYHDSQVIDKILNEEVKCAIKAELQVLFCIGEKSEEQSCWQDILLNQIETGLNGVDKSKVSVAYEPIWSIGPGKKPADEKYIRKVVSFIKQHYPELKIVYGGGLKAENAAMIGSIEELDGGLIALTRFEGEIGFYPNDLKEILQLYTNGGISDES